MHELRTTPTPGLKASSLLVEAACIHLFYVLSSHRSASSFEEPLSGRRPISKVTSICPRNDWLSDLAVHIIANSIIWQMPDTKSCPAYQVKSFIISGERFQAVIRCLLLRSRLVEHQLPNPPIWYMQEGPNLRTSYAKTGLPESSSDIIRLRNSILEIVNTIQQGWNFDHQ